MTEKLILEKLDVMARKVDKIETAVGLIAVQSERINNLQIQVQALWDKYDEACGPDGLVNKISNYQASCPRDSLKDSLTRQWIIISLLATIVISSMIKIFA